MWREEGRVWADEDDEWYISWCDSIGSQAGIARSCRNAGILKQAELSDFLDF